MSQPKRPTAELVKKYVHKFDKSDDGLDDRALVELFAIFPKNSRLDHVLLKVVAVNSLYNTGILAVERAAERIIECEIDNKLAQKSLTVVNEIARVQVKMGKIVNFYSFATKYCSWHIPEAYPIYDSYVAKLICKYQEIDKFSDFRCTNEFKALKDYPRFKWIISTFREHYQLTEFSFKDLDKFLWNYGKELFPPKSNK